MTTSISSAETQTSSARTTYRLRLRQALFLTVGLFALILAGVPASAQYTCFPTCSTTDARFLTIAGTGYNTLINSDVVMKFGSPGVATSIEIGIFDGETGGYWDAGTTPLTYTLYADPLGDGTGTTVVATFPYAQMIDNGWKSFTINNVPAAQASNGNYLYRLLIASTSATDNYWSSFKVRSTGTVALKAQAFSVAATAQNNQDLEVIYPAGLANLGTTTYDGTWRFFLDVQTASSALSVWDGDMDFGSFDCSIRDVDDQNTPNNVLPPWASPISAELEGVAAGVACVGVAGNSTGTPPDDNRYPIYQRSPAVTYQVATPQGTIFPNANPSGGREWEEFRLSTAAANPSLNDGHIDSVPSGIYEVRVAAMDLNNLNGWRFFSDVIGVTAGGDPTPPLRPHSLSGTVSFTAAAASDDNGNGNGNGHGRGNGNNDDDDDDGGGSSSASQGCGVGIPNVTMVLVGDLNGDNITDVNLTTTTNATGNYSFPALLAGSYRVYVVTSTLPAGSTPDSDYDGIVTPNVATAVIPPGGPNANNVFFCYSLQGGGSTTGVRTQGYWKNHASAWPVTSIMVGCTTYTRSRAIDIMNTSVSGDKTYSMYKQLVAAKLNVLAGANSSCIVSTIAAAESWLCTYRLGSNVGGTSNAWTNSGSALHDALDDYNNGRSCAPHMN